MFIVFAGILTLYTIRMYYIHLLIITTIRKSNSFSHKVQKFSNFRMSIRTILLINKTYLLNLFTQKCSYNAYFVSVLYIIIIRLIN